MFDSGNCRQKRPRALHVFTRLVLFALSSIYIDFVYSEEPIETYRTAFVKGENPKAWINMRENPDPSAPVLYRARPGEIFRAVDRVNGRIGTNIQFRLVDGHDGNLRTVVPLFAEEPEADQAEITHDSIDVNGYFDATGDIIVFDKPGLVKDDCSKDERGFKCVKVNDPKTPFKIIDSRIVAIDDHHRLERRYQNFYKIRYNRLNGDKTEAIERWISSQFVSTTPVIEEEPKPKDCPPASPQRQNFADLARVAKANETTVFDESVVDQISGHVGICKLEPDTKDPFYFAGNEKRNNFKRLNYNEGESPFRHMIKGHWDRAERNPPRVEVQTKAPGKPSATSSTRTLTVDELFEIDALARTLYGEMAKCVKNGPQYLAAVARIALNRAEVMRNPPTSGIWPFTKPKLTRFERHNSTSTENPDRPMPVMAHVVSTPSQFSLWNPRISDTESNNKWLKQAFCPPAHKNKDFWQGTTPPEEEQKIWRQCLEMAAKAVLQPERLKAETPGMDNLYFYTSGVGHGPGDKGKSPKSRRFDPVVVKAYGRYATNADCIEVWRERPNPPRAAGTSAARAPAKAPAPPKVTTKPATPQKSAPAAKPSTAPKAPAQKAAPQKTTKPR